jgi:hypothetical protein
MKKERSNVSQNKLDKRQGKFRKHASFVASIKDLHTIYSGGAADVICLYAATVLQEGK